MKKKKILKDVLVLLITVFLVLSTITVTGYTVNKEIKNSCSWPERGNTLISGVSGSNVIEIDNNGTVVWEKTGLNIPHDAERLDNGNTLITEYGGNRVIEVNYTGTTVWQKTGLFNPRDAERLSNGNTLITDYGNDRIIEVDNNGTIVWEKGGLDYAHDAERLENGNTLITEHYRVIEVDYNGTIVWEKGGLWQPVDADRLDNGNTLITDLNNNYVIEVDYNGTIIWQYLGGLIEPYDAERLDNGNTLISDTINWRIIEVDYNGTIIWQITNCHSRDVERINRPPYVPVVVSPLNGETEVDINVNLSWKGGDPDPGNTVTYDVFLGSKSPPEYHGTTGPHTGDPSYVVIYNPGPLQLYTTYFWKIVANDNHGASNDSPIWTFSTEEPNNAPDPPKITGPTSGKVGTSYIYKFNATDPEGNDVWYYIDWGDESQPVDWFGPFTSGIEVPRSHSFENQGTYIIYAKAKDTFGAESDWATLIVTMPRNRVINNPFLQFLKNHPSLFPILRQLLGL